MDSATFYHLCDAQFSFLVTQYGFRRTHRLSSSIGYEVEYKNATTGLRIYFEARDRILEVLLCRLVEGSLVKDPICLKRTSENYCFDIVFLAKLRCPDWHYFGIDNTDAEIESDVVEQAKLIQSLADDVLRGDFTVFAELEKMEKERL